MRRNWCVKKVRNCDCVNKVRNMFAQKLIHLIFVASFFDVLLWNARGGDCLIKII